MGGSLATPTALHMTDVSPNRWGADDPPERNDDQDDDLKAGEEVSTLYSIIFLIMGLLVGF
jgi:hypothetical protein